jgi:Putative adhesin
VRYEFSTAEAPKLRVSFPAGRIDIETADVAATVVEAEAVRGDLDNLKVEQSGRDIVIEARRRLLGGHEEYRIRVVTPFGADVEAHLASADFRATGRLGRLEVHSASGDIHAEEIEHDAEARSASGDVRLGAVGGRVDAGTASGDIRIDRVAAGGTIRSASGDVEIADASKRINVQTASGDLHVGGVAEGEVDAKSASGDVHIGIRQGSRLNVDVRSMSGETASEIPLGSVEAVGDGPLVWVKVTTMSGDIRIARA